jgi:DNA-3-methyladenine glycosylase
MSFEKLNKEFYKQDTLHVAKELLGELLVRKIKEKYIIGRIVEVEAYRQDDPASHSFSGKTERNKIMFMEGGFLYVYFTYGMYYCSNIVTENDGFGAAVLLRAVEPLSGIDIMQKNRNRKDDTVNLSNGPGKLCIAFSIDKKLNGYNLSGDEIFIARNPDKGKVKIEYSKRIGISKGNDKNWRFFIKGNKYVSKTKIT